MKRTAFIAMLMAGTLTAQADNFTYLTIEKTDGTAQSLTAVGLTISYSEGNLVATNGTESATIALADVSRMYFSNEQATTGISKTVASTTKPTTDALSDGIHMLESVLGEMRKIDTKRGNRQYWPKSMASSEQS